MSVNVFISHSHDEKALALAWKSLIKTTCLGTVTVWLSSDSNPEGGMTLGKEWRTTVYEQLKKAQFVLAIVSPQSNNRPWIMWECGVATGVDQERKLVPIVYSMAVGDLSGPLSSYQAYSGDESKAVGEVCGRLAKEAGLDANPDDWELQLKRYKDAIETYRPPRNLQPQVFQLWRQRFEDLQRTGRESEIPHTVKQFYLSIGGKRPVDVELHDRLSSFFLQEKLFDEALREVEFAIKLLPDDAILMHRKGLVLMEMNDIKAVEDLIDTAFKAHREMANWPELAGLEGRLYRAKYALTNDLNQLRSAIEAYKRAFKANERQHYPGGQACSLALQADDQQTLSELLPKVIALADAETQRPDASFWADFTLGEMSLIKKDVKAAVASYRRGTTRLPAPAARERESALAGAKRTAAAANVEIHEIVQILS